MCVADVVREFGLGGAAVVAPFRSQGNINRTYLVRSGEHDYLLQRLNRHVFPFPDRVLRGMEAALDAQGLAPEGWTAPRLIPSKAGATCLHAPDGECWRLMTLVPDVVSYRRLADAPDPMTAARECGRGLAIFSRLLRSIQPDGFPASLPGYRDTALYYRLFHSVLLERRSLEGADLPEDADTRAATERLFLVSISPEEYRRRREDPEIAAAIDLALEHQTLATTLWRELEHGRISRNIIHGDPKLENFLFDRESGRVKALVDLDTVMPFTWLADWGDMVRSLANPAGEHEEDLDRVLVDWRAGEALQQGFLSEAADLPKHETRLMDLAAQVMTLEQAVRFLTDYLRGDTYYELRPEDPPDLNRTRALVQFRLFQGLRAGPNRDML